MTKEKLIRYGKDYLQDLVTACCPISEIHKEFVREAIKALEQQSSDDCVNRQAVLDLAVDYGTNSATFLIPVCSVKNMPPVTPTRKVGKWKRKIVDDGFNADWVCSECGFKLELEFHNYRYCPNCGAEMRGDKE